MSQLCPWFFQRFRKIICKPLYQRLKKKWKPWTQEHTKVVQHIKKRIKYLPCLNIRQPNAQLIVETDASDLGFGGILKQKLDNKPKEEFVRYYSRSWNETQKNYSTVKKEVLSIVLCIKKFEDDLYMKSFLLRINCQSAKPILENDIKNIISKQIFAKWQALFSNFDFKIEFFTRFLISREKWVLHLPTNLLKVLQIKSQLFLSLSLSL